MSDKGLSTSTVSEQVFLILLSLAAGRKHGYAILNDVEAMSGKALVLSTSTLYGALGRPEREVLVGHVEAEREVAPGLPRKVCELTPGDWPCSRMKRPGWLYNALFLILGLAAIATGVTGKGFPRVARKGMRRYSNLTSDLIRLQ